MPRTGFKQAVAMFERFEIAKLLIAYAQKPLFSNTISAP
jgi:hypothetical protein